MQRTKGEVDAMVQGGRESGLDGSGGREVGEVVQVWVSFVARAAGFARRLEGGRK